MRIGEIDIPDAEIEKLANREKVILRCLYEAYPDFAVVTWTLYKVGGTGFPARKRSLIKWLQKYGVTIKKENRSTPGHSFWVYWLQEDDLFLKAPRRFIGEVS